MKITRRASSVAARRARGFSLLELTLVLIVIGLLTTVAAVNVLGAAERARVRTTKASLSTIQQQITTYRLEHGDRLPENLDVLVRGGYLEDGKMRDGWGNTFYYAPTPGRERPFDLISGGPDGDLSTPEDNISVWDVDG